MSRQLTHQQQLVYDYIRDRILTRGYGPTVREIGEHMNIKSPNGVMCHLRALERKGMILRKANKSRAIELTEANPRGWKSSLPLQGTVQHSQCLLERDASQLEFDASGLFNGDDKYALQVLDDTLHEQSIRRGDLLIIHRGVAPQPGQLAIARIFGQQMPHLVRVLETLGDTVQVEAVDRSLLKISSSQIEWLGCAIGVVRSQP